jgi:hypothetical protein
MASACASGSVMVDDQRLYITIETLRGKNPTEIHIALCEIFGEQTVDHRTVPHLATHFCEGRITINESVKLVVDRRTSSRKYHKVLGFHQHHYSVF